jgi:thiopeptide-type bacteriocin biosynthesis protein
MLPPWAEGTRWLAAHLFFNLHTGIYTGECDEVVLELAEPFVRRCQREGWIDGWFFIRYSEYGPHVRLRLHGRAEVLDEVVWPALREHVRARHPDVAFERPDVPAMPVYPPPPPASPPESPPEQEEAPFAVTHAALIDYEPETERYGGPEGVRLAERMFEVSSEACCSLLQKTSRTERSSRLGKGLLTMVELFHVFSNGDRAAAARWANQYNIGYLRGVARDEEARGAWLGAFDSGYGSQADTLGEYVEEVWSRMDEGESLSDALDLYRDGLLEVRGHFRELFDAGKLIGPMGTYTAWETAVGGICSSYLHMTNNRLGITIQEESYLAYLIMRTLQSPAESAAAAGGEGA